MKDRKEYMWELYSLSHRELEERMRGGGTPSMEAMVGWEYDGLNTPWYTAVLGIRKFRKGFYRGPARVEGGPEPFIQGYNLPVRQNGVRQEWLEKGEGGGYFGFFRVYRVHEDGLDRKYPQALLLDYSWGGNRSLEHFLRDYLVQPYEEVPEVLLGKAYVALFSWRVYVSYFILCRSRRSSYRP
ncbi:MAG: hypothetical protein D6805_01095 [Planctomycetota bacterium]|nr:MAG: hypothetical protein D6805_01095 [Planctomycetota bacterium]